MAATTFPFTPSSNDQSIFYLSKIFGYVGAVLEPPGTSAPAGQEGGSQVLGAMFTAFNTTILGVGTLIVLYITIVGVMKTASEGEFLGKSWNSIWIPIRIVLGIASLVPTASGYSTIQIIVMWVIIQGVGAADYVWSKALGYTYKFGSPLSTLTIPTVGVGNNMQNLFQALVCQETARVELQWPVQTLVASSTDYGYFCAQAGNQCSGQACFCSLSQDSSGLWDIKNPTQTPPDQFTKSTYSFQSTTPTAPVPPPGTTQGGETTLYKYNMGPGGACGYMTYCGEDTACNDTSKVANQIRCNACKAQVEALQATVTLFSRIAMQFAQADYEWRKFLTTSSSFGTSGGSQDETPEWIKSYCNAIGATEEGSCCRGGDKCKISTSLNTGKDGVNAQPDTVSKVMWPYFIKPSLTGDINFISASTDNYVSSLRSSAMSVVDDATDAQSTFGDNTTLTTANQVGWIFAGAYYYYLTRGNDNNVVASMPDWNVIGTNPKVDQNNALYTFRNNFDAASTLLHTVSQQLDDASSSSGSSGFTTAPQLQDLSKISDGLQNSGTSVMDGFYSMISGGKSGEVATNPLMQLQTLGKILLIIAQVLFALIMIVVPMLTLLGYFDVFVLGTGFDNPLGGTITTLAVIFAPLFAVFLGALFTFGALLAVYTPLIPYVVFTMGAIAWFILVIEAMVAAPIVALGVLSPGGHSEIFGKAEGALMYLLAIFLRPTLMVFGLIAAMLLSMVSVTMINAAFSGVMGEVYTNPGLVEILLFLGAYVGLILAALNKCFAMIHILPDQTLRWIGGHGEGMGEKAASEGTGRAEKGVGAAGAGAAGIGKDMKARGADMNKSMESKLGEMKEAKKGANTPTVTPTSPPPPPPTGTK